MDVRIEESWKQRLTPEFEKEYFIKLTEFVRSEYSRTTIYPPAKQIFNAFDQCPFDKTKVVIIGQDPYHGPGQAHGLCFSVAEHRKYSLHPQAKEKRRQMHRLSPQPQLQRQLRQLLRQLRLPQQKIRRPEGIPLRLFAAK